ncbi:hypothetical protein MGG_15687 [Pyricularia oryzae 70-15]|uniref:Uncharacterized protein n=3 Tax=Pyricularia oryzae TaxID=318829 RepID=G4MZ46_PYRO7|nr:uncharacterized protein MGG_15687 [Pyricularia oryzae 70-15]EHA54513.1 hypothetical protein MGG_15687 [Pyricularia oryzae 70-15]ELQ41962.1 hypothetical protein OOU_Y34scaffold00245g13 [Pyricularia oryzae Y34]
MQARQQKQLALDVTSLSPLATRRLRWQLDDSAGVVREASTRISAVTHPCRSGRLRVRCWSRARCAVGAYNGTSRSGPHFGRAIFKMTTVGGT